MKKIIICAMLLTLSVTSFCQQTQSTQRYTREDYLTKSAKERTTAWVLLGGGGAAFLGGLIWGIGVSNSYPTSLGFSTVPPSALIGSAILLITGAASMLVSIHFFHSSKVYKKKATELSAGLILEKEPLLMQTGASNYYPALALKIFIKEW